jgi:hypothetical protein
VSSDIGLEQDFNSLDSQREAAVAYVKSQGHEGWVLPRERYDDGGFYGGDARAPAALLRAHATDRPAALLVRTMVRAWPSRTDTKLSRSTRRHHWRFPNQV